MKNGLAIRQAWVSVSIAMFSAVLVFSQTSAAERETIHGSPPMPADSSAHAEGVPVVGGTELAIADSLVASDRAGCQANFLTNPDDPRNWQGAAVGTFAQLIYGADTLDECHISQGVSQDFNNNIMPDAHELSADEYSRYDLENQSSFHGSAVYEGELS